MVARDAKVLEQPVFIQKARATLIPLLSRLKRGHKFMNPLIPTMFPWSLQRYSTQTQKTWLPLQVFMTTTIQGNQLMTLAILTQELKISTSSGMSIKPQMMRSSARPQWQIGQQETNFWLVSPRNNALIRISWCQILSWQMGSVSKVLTTRMIPQLTLTVSRCPMPWHSANIGWVKLNSLANPSKMLCYDSTYSSYRSPLLTPREVVGTADTKILECRMSATPSLVPHSLPQNCAAPLLANSEHQNSIHKSQGHPSVSSGNNSHQGPSNDSTEPCICLQTTVSLLEDIDSKLTELEPQSIDSTMDWHRDVLAECSSILDCKDCTTRPERMMLITMVAEKLVNLCEQASKSCLTTLTPPPSRPNTALGHNNVSTSMHSTRNETSCFDAESPFETSFCGQYKIESSKDWACLIRVVICLQLKSMRHFLRKIRLVVSLMERRDAHVRKVDTCEERVQKAFESLCKITQGLWISNLDGCIVWRLKGREESSGKITRSV